MALVIKRRPKLSAKIKSIPEVSAGTPTSLGWEDLGGYSFRSDVLLEPEDGGTSLFTRGLVSFPTDQTNILEWSLEIASGGLFPLGADFLDFEDYSFPIYSGGMFEIFADTDWFYDSALSFLFVYYVRFETDHLEFFDSGMAIYSGASFPIVPEVFAFVESEINIVSGGTLGIAPDHFIFIDSAIPIGDSFRRVTVGGNFRTTVSGDNRIVIEVL